MQEDFNQHGLESFRFEILDVGDPKLNEKNYRIKREIEELNKYPTECLYNKPQGAVYTAQRVRIHGIEYNSIGKAVSETTYSKTNIIRKLNRNEPGCERLENIPLHIQRSKPIVIYGVVYPSISEAVKICRMHFYTIKQCLENPSNIDFEYYNF